MEWFRTVELISIYHIAKPQVNTPDHGQDLSGVLMASKTLEQIKE
jgi:hypothetical protein